MGSPFWSVQCTVPVKVPVGVSEGRVLVLEELWDPLLSGHGVSLPWRVLHRSLDWSTTVTPFRAAAAGRGVRPGVQCLN